MDSIIALDLPTDAQVNQRAPKKLLVEHGAPTAGDKRLINDGIEELRWRAALKPHTVGVPEYCDTEREYLEIAVLTLALRPGAKRPRLEELMHRAVQKIRTELEATHEQNPKTRQQSLFADSASSRAPSSLDLGFRVFKLDTSNIRPWSPDRDNLEISLMDNVEHIKDDRSEADVLYELLLKLGLDLCVPMDVDLHNASKSIAKAQSR